MKIELWSSEQLFLPENAFFRVICAKKREAKMTVFWCFWLFLRSHIYQNIYIIGSYIYYIYYTINSKKIFVFLYENR